MSTPPHEPKPYDRPYRFTIKRRLLKEIESVLEPSETLQVFVEEAIRREIARRRRAREYRPPDADQRGLV
jgi:hypothetical protein